jgi:hypothetical protein
MCRELILNILGSKEEYWRGLFESESSHTKELEREIGLIKEDDSVKPTFIDESLYPYKPFVSIVEGSFALDEPRSIFNKDNFIIKKTVEENRWKSLDLDAKLKAIWYYVIDRCVYMYDISEDWQPSFFTFYKLRGDCVPLYEEIITADGIKKVGELVEGDMVLSYDFKGKEFCNKKITKIWEKGNLPLKRVHLRNGQHIDVTENHPLLARVSQEESVYEKKCLNDIDLTRWWKRKIPIAVKIPYVVKDIEWLTRDLCVVLGHYLAEGWNDKYKVASSGYELIEEIIPILEEYNIPFTEYRNNNNVPCINFLKSDFKDFLKKQMSDSFDIHISEEIMHLPPEKLDSILYGYYIGDGTKNVGMNQGNKEYVLSTSSERFSQDIQRMGLQLGRTFHIWKQIHHGGVGRKPIYRITYNPKSHFLKNFGYEGISEVSISYVEDIGTFQTRDFEVEDTHNFIFKNGLISHNCEDSSILMVDLCRAAGVPADSILLATGWFKDSSGNKFGHAFPICKNSDGKWYIYESTLDNSYLKYEPKLFKGSNYDCSWGLINDRWAGKSNIGDNF